MTPRAAIILWLGVFAHGAPVAARWLDEPPPPAVVRGEVNTVVNEFNVPRFTQFVGWSPHPTCTTERVAGWLMIEPGDQVVRTAAGYSLVRASIDAKPAVIRFERYERTRTAWDCEEIDRGVVPPEERIGW